MWATALWQIDKWRFDLRSALLGALIAWSIAWLLYHQRAALRRRWEQLLAPLVRWRTHSQRSTGEKYLSALQDALRRLLLFAPADPLKVFVAPTFLAPAELPATPAEAAEIPTSLLLLHEALLQGHPRVVITGTPGSGRTMALAMMVWLNARQTPSQGQSRQRFPMWIDLALPGEPSDPKATPVQIITDWVTRFMPQAIPKWLIRQMRSQPTLILLDNWDALSPAAKADMAQLIAQAATALPDSFWLIAAGTEGYGPLVEVGFAPVQIQPTLNQDTPADLYTGWASILGNATELPEESLAVMRWAIAAGDTLAEQTLRINLQLRSQRAPYRPAEVLEALLRDVYLPQTSVEDNPQQAMQVQDIAAEVLAQLARIARIEGRAITAAQLQELLDRLIPVGDRQDRLPGLVRKVIQSTSLLDRSGRGLRFVHPIWEDFLAARALAKETSETNLEPLLLLERLYDPEWRYLLDCYTGLSDAEPLIKALLRDGLALAARPDDSSAQEALLLAARWTIRAPESISWRSYVIKALAQILIQPPTPPEYRLRLAESLALVAGEEAYAFFQQALRHPALPVRIAALRGIGWTGSAKDLKLLTGALKDPHREVQESALHAISDLGISDAYNLLGELLPQSSEPMMLLITEILAAHPESWDVLREATRAEDLLVRRAAAHGLGAIRQLWAYQRLQEMARDDPQWLVRSAAEASLGAHQGSRNVAAAPPRTRRNPVAHRLGCQTGFRSRRGPSRTGLAIACSSNRRRSIAHAGSAYPQPDRASRASACTPNSA